MTVVRLPIDQNQIWFDVAIAMIGPFPDKRMVALARRQRFVDGKQVDNFH
jgi:hypothetical protein